MSERTADQRRFDLILRDLSPNVREIYDNLLLKEQITRGKKGPVTISVEEREEILNRARQKAQFGHADASEMAVAWDSYDRRPPIGGAQDD